MYDGATCASWEDMFLALDPTSVPESWARVVPGSDGVGYRRCRQITSRGKESHVRSA
jgi:hypothetical protein